MTILAKAVLMISLPVSMFAPAPRTPVTRAATREPQKHGQWYLAGTGHAVYCYGPVKLVLQPEGSVQRVATYCKGDKFIVPLKD